MGTKQYDSATDLITFSRASKGTALRKVSYGPELVTNGTFDTDTTGWVNGAGSTTTFIQTGGVIQITASGGNARVNTQSAITLEVGKTYTFTAECTQKDAESGSFIHLGITSGVAEIKSSIGLNEPAGVYSHTFVATNSSLFIQLGAKTTTASVSYDNISVKEVTFDQADGTLELFNHPDDVPRIEYDATGAVKGLLIEEARTNLVTYSNDLTAASWLKTNNSNTANAGVSPDGTSNANKVVPTTSSGVHYTYQNLDFSSTDHSFSVYVASAGYGFATICAGTNHNNDHYAVVIDLSDGTQTALYSAGAQSKTVTVEPVGSFYRVTISGSGEKYYVVGASDTGTYTPSDYGFKSFQGDGTSGILVYGAQAEAGAFPTSYIPTTGATATRAADLASIPTSAFGYNSGAGAMFVEAESFGIVSGSTNRFMCINNGSSSERINFFIENNSNLGFIITDNGVTQSIVFSSAASNGTVFKVAGAYHLNDVAFSGNDLTPSVDTSATLPTVTQMQIGNETGLNFLNGHIKSIKYYPRRLTNAQLQELTT